MSEMEEALRSCMERLVIAREEREQIIVEAANEISAEKKKAHDLQHKLEDANKKAAKLAAENSSLRKATDAKDALIAELSASEAATRDELAGATAGLESAQRQAGSLQYEVRMLQKELEVRGQEREYDLESAAAARRREAEHVRRIAQLEAECHRLRAMVRKRLPGPAAIAKMRDEVDQPPPGASPRRPRPAATPSSPARSVTTPFSPRTTPSPRRSVSDAEVKLRAVEEENAVLKQALAKREGELEFVQMRYADEASKLTAVQRRLKELTEENRQLSDVNCQSESWASALISELEQFRSGNQNGGASIMASDMNLLDDFAEIEKLEMESGDRKPKAPPASSSPKEEDRRSVTLEKSGDELVTTGSIPNGHPEKVHDIWNLVVHKHEASGESVDTIFEKIRHALDLDRIDVHAKREDSDVSYDLSEIEKMVRDLVQKITHMIGTSAEDNGVRSRPLLHGKYELCGRLEYLVQVCHDLLHGKANLEKFIDEVCLTLKYMVSQYLSNQDLYDTVDSATKNCDGDKSLGTVNTQSPQEFQSAKPGEAVSIQKEVQEGPVQSTEDQSMVNHQERFDKELTGVIIAQDDNIVPGRKSTYCEIESPAAEASVEVWAAQGENQSPAALKIPTSGPLDSPLCNPRPSSAKSDYKPQSLASILAEEFANAVGSNSPAHATPNLGRY